MKISTNVLNERLTLNDLDNKSSIVETSCNSYRFRIFLLDFFVDCEFYFICSKSVIATDFVCFLLKGMWTVESMAAE